MTGPTADTEPHAMAATDTPVATGAPVPPPRIPTWWAVGAALLAGAALLLAFPVYNVVVAAPAGVALLAVAVRGRGFAGGFRLGGLTGLVLFVPLLSWTYIVGGPAPWLLLAVMEALFVALLGGAAAVAGASVARWRWTWPLVTAALWVAQEAARDRAPFGGFPWGRLAFSQGDTPALRYAAAGGAPLVTFAVALAGGLLAVALWRVLPAAWTGARAGGATTGPAAGEHGDAPDAHAGGHTRAPGRVRVVVAAIVGAAAVIVGGLAVPTGVPDGRTVRVAIVQGNVPRLGLEFNAQRRAVLDNHVRATLELADEVRAGRTAKPDIVIWPENSSDIDPLIGDDPDNSDANQLISHAANVIGAPILVGAVLEGPGANARNAGIVWLPDSGPRSGPSGMYVKRHPVPFAEYIPLRSIARMVSKRVDLVTHDFLAGTTPGVLDMGGRATIGDVICFEVAYDGIVRDTVTGGAQLLTVQTNNADFNPAEARQQLAMVRLRAVEHGRDALMVSTVGVSGFVDSAGRVHQATGFNVASTQLRDLRLGDQRTLATRLGAGPEYAITIIALGMLAAAGWLRINRRKTVAAEQLEKRQNGTRETE